MWIRLRYFSIVSSAAIDNSELNELPFFQTCPTLINDIVNACSLNLLFTLYTVLQKFHSSFILMSEYGMTYFEHSKSTLFQTNHIINSPITLILTWSTFKLKSFNFDNRLKYLLFSWSTCSSAHHLDLIKSKRLCRWSHILELNQFM